MYQITNCPTHHLLTVLLTALAIRSIGCESPTPSAHVENQVYLPVPTAQTAATSTTTAPQEGAPQTVRLSARSLIPIAFHLQPEIKSSFQAFKSEEARYDFFYASNDALTPHFRSNNQFGEDRSRDAEDRHDLVLRDRDHSVEVGVDKQFFDTTRMSIATGLDVAAIDEDLGNHPFVTASVRYPLWGSREKLERTSEDIFRQNELNDAQLAYITKVRRQLQQALERFNEVVELRTRVASSERWQRDLTVLGERLDSASGRDLASDRRRLEAELARTKAESRNLSGRYQIELARLQYDVGLPYETAIELDEEPFNPFQGIAHAELIRATIETDPEIATLRNAMRNAEVQLDLARHGQWDVAFLMNAQSNLEGGGADDSASQWSVAGGLEVSAVDPRVTTSLTRQAEASIERFRQAIAARENAIFVDTLEPLVRIETLSASRNELRDNLVRYHGDYATGVEEYVAGKLNIDDLLKRRENIFDQETEVAELTNLVGINVAELCAATGKFFELLRPKED